MCVLLLSLSRVYELAAAEEETDGLDVRQLSCLKRANAIRQQRATLSDPCSDDCDESRRVRAGQSFISMFLFSSFCFWFSLPIGAKQS